MPCVRMKLNSLRVFAHCNRNAEKNYNKDITL